jgi:glyoxylase-like metal-dependent hydrolase (beta-lactamase superfamily II)
VEIVSGIHQIDGVRGANSYLVVSKGSILVIDTGLPGNARRITKYFRGLGLELGRVKYIILTHADIDHSGSAAELREITGAKLAIHTGDARRLSGDEELKEVAGILGFLFRILTRLMRFRHVEPDIILRGDDEIGGFKAIYTPGHTGGSICLYRPKEVIFVGDAMRSDKKGNLLLPSPRLSQDKVQAMNSLKRISELEFNTLLTGHGAPVVGNASDRVRRLLANIR